MVLFLVYSGGVSVLTSKLVPVEQVTPSAAPDDSQLKKWGVAGRAGFQVVPNVLFRAQQHLGLDSTDVVILLNLFFTGGTHNLPFLSPALISQRMGVTRRTVERRLEVLERKGLIKRLKPSAPAEGKPKVRKFELTGLVAKLEIAALQGLSQREFVKRQKQERLTTGSPGSSVRIERHKQQRPGLPPKEDNLARVEVGVGGSSPPPVSTSYSSAAIGGAKTPALVHDSDIPF